MITFPAQSAKAKDPARHKCVSALLPVIREQATALLNAGQCECVEVVHPFKVEMGAASTTQTLTTSCCTCEWWKAPCPSFPASVAPCPMRSKRWTSLLSVYSRTVALALQLTSEIRCRGCVLVFLNNRFQFVSLQFKSARHYFVCDCVNNVLDVHNSSHRSMRLRS